MQNARLLSGASSAVLKAVLLLTLGVCVFMSGCTGSETIWSAEAKSPDGRVVASAGAVLRNRHLSVISGVDTNVYLSWASDRRPPMLILTLADGSDVPVDTNVEMSWLTPTHLELTYKGNQTVGFEAIKWADVEISVRDLASERTQTGAVNLRNGARNLQAPPPFAYRKTTAPQ
jgi:hypothetical protein